MPRGALKTMAGSLAGLALIAAVGTTAACTPGTGASQDLSVVAPAAKATHTPGDAGSAGGSDIYSKGAFSIQLTVHNETDQEMNLVPEYTFHSDGAHWAQQPSATLEAHTSDTVTAYTNSPVGFNLGLTYLLPNNEYACASVGDLVVTDNGVASGVGTDWSVDDNWFKIPDPAYRTDVGTVSSGDHIWADIPLGVRTNG